MPVNVLYLVNFEEWMLSLSSRISNTKPIFFAILMACLKVLAIPLSACFNFNLTRRFLNRSLSSAKSIEVYCVPKIGSLF